MSYLSTSVVIALFYLVGFLTGRVDRANDFERGYRAGLRFAKSALETVVRENRTPEQPEEAKES